MKQTLQLRLSQHLALTPQLQQSIRLLQLSTLDLNQEIEKFLQDNPLLEREDFENESPTYSPSGDAMSSTATSEVNTPEGERGASEMDSGQDWFAEAGPNYQRSDDDEPDYAEIQAASTSLRDHLNSQLAFTTLTSDDRSLVRLLIEALDDDGYLTQTLEELAQLLPPELEFDVEDLRIALRHLQNFDPPGIGARTAQECLALQLRNLPACDVRELALQIVERHLELLAGHEFTRLKKLLQCDDESLRKAHHLIRTLNPRPGAQFSPLDTRYVVPDVVVKKFRAQWLCTLNPDAMPKLRINRLYADILHSQRGNGSSLVESAPGSEVADQERSAAIRHDPACFTGDRGPPAPVLRVRGGGDATSHLEGDRRATQFA